VLNATLTTAAYTDTSADDTFASVTGLLTRTDVDSGDTALYSIASQTTGSYSISGSSFDCQKVGLYGTLYLNSTSGSYVYVPDDAAIEGRKTDSSEVFTLVVTDSGSATDTKTVTINITGANDAPVLNAVTSGSVAEVDQSSRTTDAGLNGTLTSTDRDSAETLSYGISGTGVTNNGNGTVSKVGAFGTMTVNTSTGAYSYAKQAVSIEALNAGESGSDNFTLNITDGSGSVSTQSYTVTITGADDVPVFSSGGTGTVLENEPATTVIYTAHATDADGDTLTYSLAGTDASLLAINGTTGEVRLIDPANYEAKDSYVFSVVASDGNASHDVTHAVVVGVTDVNESPSSTDDSVTTLDNVTNVLAVTDFGIYSDPENVALAAIKIISLPAAGTLQYSSNGTDWNPVSVNELIPAADITAGKLRFVPVSGMPSVSFGFQVSDGVLTSSSTYTLNIYADHAVSLGAGSGQTVKNDSGATVYTVDVPTGVSFVTEVLTDRGLTVDEQINAFADNLISDPASYEQVHGVIDSYVGGIGSTAVEVRSITLDDSSGFDASHPVVIAGSASGSEALVIDASKLPPGTVLDLNNVEFAIIIGPSHFEGGLGSNIIIADGSNQYIVLGPDDDTIHGGGGDDTIGSHEGNDVLYGDEGNDTVFGGVGNDSLYGGTGNDILSGEAGNDSIDGGDGDDTATFSGNHTRYSISYDEATHTYTVVDTVSGGGDGTDHVTNVEHFQFADGTYNPADTVDHTAPTILTHTPVDGATGVALSDNIVIRFSEAVQRGTGLIEIHSGSATGTVVESFEASSNSHLSITGDTLTIDPSANLSNGTEYYVTFADGSVHDFAGNHYAGSTDYNFSTVAAAVAASGGSSSGGVGVALAGVAGIGLIAWLVL
jgi:VCBS repeat-containing protein